MTEAERLREIIDRASDALATLDMRLIDVDSRLRARGVEPDPAILELGRKVGLARSALRDAVPRDRATDQQLRAIEEKIDEVSNIELSIAPQRSIHGGLFL